MSARLKGILAQIHPRDLRIWCYDQPDGQPLYRRLQRQTTDATLIGWLVEATALRQPLLAWLQADYPRLYAAYHTPLTNPFHSGRGYLHQADQFYGRAKLLRELRNHFAKFESIALLCSQPSLGGSSLFKQLELTQRAWLPPQVTVAYVDLYGVWDHHDFFDAVIKKLGGQGDSHGAFRQTIHERQIILLLDEVEQLADQDFNPKLQKLLRASGQREQFALGVIAKKPLEQTFPSYNQGELSPFVNIFTPKQLDPFAEWECREFLQHRLHPTDIQFSPAELDHLVQACQGIPAKLQQLAHSLFAQKT